MASVPPNTPPASAHASIQSGPADAQPHDRDLAAVRWLESFIDFEKAASGAALQRVPFARGDYSLTPFRRLLARLGDPQDARPTLHIAGTKGKGSCAMLADRLARAMGLTTGRYTSPHLHSYRERIALGGEPVDAPRFERVFGELRGAVEAATEAAGGAAPERAFRSLFELMTAGAWMLFRDEAVDLAILEVGLGGRLDATNCVAQPRATLVTSIGYDHTKILGETIELIAREKAGIFKAGAPAVIRRQHHAQADAIIATLEARATEIGSPIVRAWEKWQVIGPRPGALRQVGAPGVVDIHRRGRPLGQWTFGLAGKHQAANLEAALAAFEATGLGPDTDEEWVALLDTADLGTARHAGRFEVLSTEPPIVVDGAHCPLSLGALRDQLTAPEGAGRWRWSVAFGLLGHKERDRMAAALRDWTDVARWWAVGLDDVRAIGETDVLRFLRDDAHLGDRAVAASGLRDNEAAPLAAADAVEAVVLDWIAHREPNDALLFTGSLFIVEPARDGVRRAIGRA